MSFDGKIPMTPDEFRHSVMPRMMTMWNGQCFCSAPRYRKIIGFNYQDYGIGPVALADSEILIQEFIRSRSIKIAGPDKEGFEITQTYECPQCHRRITEHYDEYSINMSRSYVSIEGDENSDLDCLFIVGWFGFDSKDFAKIEGFSKTDSIDHFLNQMTAVEQGAQPDAFGAG